MIKTLTVVSCAPVADFNATPKTTCSGTSVSFTDLSTNLPTAWNWTFTGGTPSSSTSQNPSVVYNTSGTYQVQLIAMNGSGTNTATKSSYITINSVPAITGTIIGSSSACKNKMGVTYSITPSANATGYSWTVPADASITNGQGTNNIQVSFGSTSGNVEVTAVNTCGSSNSKSTAVVINSCDTVPASIQAINSLASIVVYPNPTNNVVFINLGKSIAAPSLITLMDVRGNVVFQANDFAQQLLKIDMSNESAGIYILTIKNNYQMNVIKVVKQ